MLPTDSQDRKNLPIYSGVMRYFPLAMAEIARVSVVGNEKHNPGQHLHWDKAKSTDEADALVRHLLEAGTTDTDGIPHSAKVAWRACALLEREMEAKRDRELLMMSNAKPTAKPTVAPGMVLPPNAGATQIHAGTGGGGIATGGVTSGGAIKRIEELRRELSGGSGGPKMPPLKASECPICEGPCCLMM